MAYGVSLGPDLLQYSDSDSNLFSFHVVQEKHGIILNKTGAHVLDGGLVLPRSCNGVMARLCGQNAKASTALATFADRPSPGKRLLY